MALLQDGRGGRIDTPLGPDHLLLEAFTLHEEFSEGFSGRVQLLSTDSEIDPRALVGETVTLTLDTPDGPRVFNAHVSEFTYSGARGRLSAYEMSLVPWMHFLTLRSDCRIFLDKSVVEIIREIVALTPFSDKLDVSQLGAQYPKREYCVQYNETPADFIHRLMQEEGIASRYEHEASKHTLVLSDWNDQFAPVPGDPVVPYFPPERQSRTEQSIGSWRWSHAASPGQYTTTDYDFKVPTKSMEADSKGPDGHAVDDGEVFQWPGQYVDPARGRHLAGIRREQLQAEREVVHASSDVARLYVGRTFTLDGFPRALANKPWLVTQITHSFDGVSYESGTGGGVGVYRNAFTASDPAALYRPSRIRQRPVIAGSQTATVTGAPGEEISTDEHGRVTVHFHWDRHGPMDANSSCWIRVAQSMAGPEFGGQFIPRVGQEVVVEFLDGNPDRPIITGCVYNGDNTPPFALPDNKTQSGFRSNSSKGGGGANEIRLEDLAGEEVFFTHAQKDKTERVLNTRTARIDKHDVYSVGANRAVEVEGNEKHEVAGSINLTVGATGAGPAGFLSGLAGLSSHSAGLLEEAGKEADTPSSLGRYAKTLSGTTLGYLSGAALGKRGGVVAGGDPIADGGRELTESGQGVGDAAGGLFPMPGVMYTVVTAFRSDTVGLASVEQVGMARVVNVGGAAMEAVGKRKGLVVGETYDYESKDAIAGRAVTHRLSATEEFVIAGPGGSIIIDKSGVTIKTKHLKVKSPKVDFTSGSAPQADALASTDPFVQECPKGSKA